MTWEYFILGVIAAQIGKMLYLIGREGLERHREKSVLRVARVKFPDNSSVTFTSVETSDKKAMEEIKRDILAFKPLSVARVNEYEMTPFPERPPSS